MYSEILKIIEGSLNNDQSKVIDYSKRLIKKLNDEGNTSYAKAIREIISRSNSNFGTLDYIREDEKPIETSLDFLNYSIDSDFMEDLVLDPTVRIKIKNFIDRILHEENLKSKGVSLKNTLLLYGPPGSGKTTLAKYISFKTQKPLIAPRLDSLLISFLKNDSKPFQTLLKIVNKRAGILFLDEFDAIAKSRDERFDSGKLNRMINSLLQNIDILSEDITIIAATNRHDLLDNAVWSRFNSIIHVLNPDQIEIEKLIRKKLTGVDQELSNDKKKIEIISSLLMEKSTAEISNLIDIAIAQSIINSEEKLDYFYLLQEVFKSEKKGEENFKEFINFLNNNGIPQTSIANKLEISMRQVRNYLNKVSL